MAVLNNDDIKKTFEYLSTIENILVKELRKVEGNKSHLDKIVPENITGVYSGKEKTA